MKKRIVISIFVLILLITSSTALAYQPYNGAYAAQYALNHYNNPNPNFNEWSADCTNFASQAVWAGGFQMVYPNSPLRIGVMDTSNHWFSRKIREERGVWPLRWTVEGWAESSTWIRVERNRGFYPYWKGILGPNVIETSNWRTLLSHAKPGDIIQLRRSGEQHRSHSIVVTQVTNDNIYIAQRSANRKGDVKDISERYSHFTLFKFNSIPVNFPLE
ncbi:amidase domain-containing protein [Anaerobranca gottschalkii]|uniref:Amidase domain-containing protein n=1 Tax=Anaerobranca gottschalkii DSM 13577 TaxID=1120990 RepID=A0A1I0BJN5_9FIRM|nr:amidase domain-containing protein [Anaerobranca gottschalkii]SET07219.1 Putative amidase domain-containing protein [Anaerobranca gottschalkii DSM 13577]